MQQPVDAVAETEAERLGPARALGEDSGRLGQLFHALDEPRGIGGDVLAVAVHDDHGIAFDFLRDVAEADGKRALVSDVFLELEDRHSGELLVGPKLRGRRDGGTVVDHEHRE
jgi:hypothetical protein